LVWTQARSRVLDGGFPDNTTLSEFYELSVVYTRESKPISGRSYTQRASVPLSYSLSGT